MSVLTVLGSVFSCLRLSFGFSVQQILEYVGQKGPSSFTLDLQVGKWAIADGSGLIATTCWTKKNKINKTSLTFLQFHSATIFSGPGSGMRTLFALSLAVLVNSWEQRVLLQLPWQPSFFSLYGLASLVNPRDKLIKMIWVAFHLKLAGIVVGKIERTRYCEFLLWAGTKRNDFSRQSQYCLLQK